MANKGSNRRRKIIVNEPLQKRLVLSVTTFPTIALTLVTLVMAVICRRLLGEASRAEVELPSLAPLFLSVLGFVTASAIVVLLQALRFSHRIAGPIYRITQSLQRVRTGDIGFRVTLRKGDHLTEIAEELNLLLDWLNANPPTGSRTGSDMIQLESIEEGAESARETLEGELEPEPVAITTLDEAKD